MSQYAKNTSGFALIEVLISMLIMGIALKGIGGFWVSAVQESEHNYSRSQALTIAMNVIEFVKANPQGWTEYSDGDNWSMELSNISQGPDSCFSTDQNNLIDCTPATMAMADIYTIRDYTARSMPLFNGSVELRAPCFNDSDVACVIVAWMDTDTDECDPLADGAGVFKKGQIGYQEEFLEEFQCVLIDFMPQGGVTI